MSCLQLTDQQINEYMALAIDEAKQAGMIDEVPIGAVVIHDGKVVGRGHNLREHFQDVTYHAELMAITEACQTLHSWRLEDCQLFVTLEPCMMCSGVILNSRIPELYFGASDPKAGTVTSLYQLLSDDRMNHQVSIHAGIRSEECSKLLTDFFRAIRQRRNRKRQGGLN